MIRSRYSLLWNLLAIAVYVVALPVVIVACLADKVIAIIGGFNETKTTL